MMRLPDSQKSVKSKKLTGNRNLIWHSKMLFSVSKRGLQIFSQQRKMQRNGIRSIKYWKLLKVRSKSIRVWKMQVKYRKSCVMIMSSSGSSWQISDKNMVMNRSGSGRNWQKYSRNWKTSGNRKSWSRIGMMPVSVPAFLCKKLELRRFHFIKQWNLQTD